MLNFLRLDGALEYQDSIYQTLSDIGAVLRRAKISQLFLVIALLTWSFNSYAANGQGFEMNLAQILRAFEAEILAMKRSIYIFSKNLIFYLGVLAIACRGIYLILQQGTLFTFAVEFVKLIFLFGLIRFFLLNGYDFATDIINSLLSLINGNSLGNMTTTQTLNEFFEFVADFAQTLSPNNAIFFAIFMVLMYVAICFLFILYIVRYLSVLFILVFGSISIVFAVFRQTRFIVFNFVSLALGCALKFVALCFIIRVGEKIVSTLITNMRMDIITGLTLSLQDAGFVLLVLFLVCAAAFYLPMLLSKICMPVLTTPSPIRI